MRLLTTFQCPHQSARVVEDRAVALQLRECGRLLSLEGIHEWINQSTDHRCWVLLYASDLAERYSAAHGGAVHPVGFRLGRAYRLMYDRYGIVVVGACLPEIMFEDSEMACRIRAYESWGFDSTWDGARVDSVRARLGLLELKKGDIE